MVDIRTEKNVETWILLFLYHTNRTLEDMLDYGCKYMVFGRKLSDLETTLQNMKEKGLIGKYTDGTYRLKNEGKFQVKSTVLLPYLGITEDNIDMLIEKLKDECDLEFIQQLAQIIRNYDTSEEHNLFKQHKLTDLGADQFITFLKTSEIISNIFLY